MFDAVKISQQDLMTYSESDLQKLARKFAIKETNKKKLTTG